jgi:AcrR family transcriptional regulator
MTELSAQRGYQAVTIAQLSSHAGVSSATFYEQFESKEDCLLAAYRTAAERVLGQVALEHGENLSESERADAPGAALAALAALLSALQREPDAGRVLFIEAFAAGPKVLEAGRRLLEEIEQNVQGFLDSTPREIGVLDLPSVALIGALRSIISRRLRTHAEDELPALAGDFVRWVESYATHERKARWSTGRRAFLNTTGGLQPADPQIPTRLPRGRHRLPPGVVARSRRTRIIHGTAEVMLAKGYEDATVADIVAAAGVARDVFYEHFSDKQHAFLEAQQYSTQDILDACAIAYFRGEAWPERVWRGLETLIAVIVANPALAHLRLVECYAAGPAAVRRAEEITRAFAIFLEEGYGYRRQARELPRLCSQAITGAIFEVIQRDIARGEPAALARQLPQLAYIAIAPFTGPDAAVELVEELKAGAPKS